METLDPTTGLPLPSDAIQRIIFLSPSVHIYNIPPLTSTKGYVATTWTADNNKRQIFTARLRILETALPTKNKSGNGEDEETVKTDILLEDPKTGDLFAAAPYTSQDVVEQVLDSSRFFAVRVQGEGGRRAVLGIGFEERSDAFDFSVALQEVRRTLGLEPGSKPGGKPGAKGKGKEEGKRDFSLKEGETIVVNIGGRSAGRKLSSNSSEGSDSDVRGFSLPPPPPSAQQVRAKKRLSQSIVLEKKADTIEDLGFDDGEFGEFQ